MSQFASLFKKDTKVKADALKEEKKPKNKTVKKKPDATLPPSAESPPATPVKAEKRIAGKSSNSDYTQVLSYIRKDTHMGVKAALIFDERKRDLSDLIEELLAEWLKSKSNQ